MKRRESFGPGDLEIQNVSTSNLISGGASADYDTLKEIEDKMKQLEAGGVAVDKTLTVENMPADAGAVGKLKEDMNNVSEANGISKIQSQTGRVQLLQGESVTLTKEVKNGYSCIILENLNPFDILYITAEGSANAAA